MTALALRIIGKDGSHLVSLRPGVLWVGRSPTADIRIDDPEISRKQFSLERISSRHGVRLRVCIDPDSRNEFQKDGMAQRELFVQPGESFLLGSYRFEFQVEPSPAESGELLVPNDPAGTVEPASLEEGRRIAPHWQLSGTQAESTSGGAVARPAVLGALVAALISVGGGAAWALGLFDPPVLEQSSALTATRPPDLLKVIPKLECDGAQACLARAADSVQQARRLQQGGSRDLMTLYRIARHLHRAYTTLGVDANRIPDLAEKYDVAKTDLESAFGDLYFRLKRSIVNEHRRDQLITVRAIYPLCEEDSHEFCHGLELFYKRIKD